MAIDISHEGGAFPNTRIVITPRPAKDGPRKDAGGR